MVAWTKSRLVAIVTGLVLIAAGGSVLGLAVTVQGHAPEPGPAQAGSTGPVAAPAPPKWPDPGSMMVRGPTMARSLPISISIPAIGVDSRLLYVGLNPDGTIQVPPLNDPRLTDEAAWYKYSPTPGQLGPSVIE